ncbi:MAG: FAD:protein FMN transferase [Pseudomonadota bacterium]
MRRVLIAPELNAHLPPGGSSQHCFSGRTMGTSWTVRAMLDASGDWQARLQHALDAVVAQMSHWDSNSDLSRYNEALAGSWHALPAECMTVLRYALSVAEACDGAYDPCAGALVNLWGFGARRRYDEAEFYAPEAGAIDAILARADRSRIKIDPISGKVLQPGGLQLDFSSVAKGFAVDQLARLLEGSGVHHYLIEVGGELRGAGMKRDVQPWWVGLEAVPGSDDASPVVVALHGLSIATSGDYRRYFEHAGWRASHTLDPRTGYPIRNEVASVTVLHPECMAADALSTALSVLGPDAGLAFANRHALAARFLLRRDSAVEERSSAAFNALLA